MRLLFRLLALALVAAAGLVPAAQAKPGDTSTFMLALKRNQGSLDRLALRVSAPASGRRGAYVPLGQIERRFGASRATRRTVLRFLARRGARARVRGFGAMVVAELPARKALRLFGKGRRTPDALRGVVTGVAPISTSAGPSSSPPHIARAEIPKRSGTPSGCPEGLASGGFTPNQYVKAYGIDALHRAGLRGRGMRIALIETDGFRRSDIEVYTRCFGLPTPAMRVFPVGVPRVLAPGDETTLDLEVLSGVAPRARYDVYEGGDSQPQLALTFAAPLDAPARRRPDVISASLGVCELGLQGEAVAVGVLEYLYAAAAAGGISMLSASGDHGSSSCAADGIKRRSPNYPSTSPWVTGVGGTEFTLDSQNRLATQTVWNDLPLGVAEAGGGGPSTVFDRPLWQRAPGVSGKARISPDVSFLGDPVPGYAIYCTAAKGGCTPPGWSPFGGTSAATPLFAGSLGLIGERAKRTGRPLPGFVSPLLYALAREAGGSRGPVFRDIRTGNDDLYGVGCCSAGRNYDPASGLGSLDLSAFMEEALREG
jgi:kumamolisin